MAEPREIIRRMIERRGEEPPLPVRRQATPLQPFVIPDPQPINFGQPRSIMPGGGLEQRAIDANLDYAEQAAIDPIAANRQIIEQNLAKAEAAAAELGAEDTGGLGSALDSALDFFTSLGNAAWNAVESGGEGLASLYWSAKGLYAAAEGRTEDQYRYAEAAERAGQRAISAGGRSLSNVVQAGGKALEFAYNAGPIGLLTDTSVELNIGEDAYDLWTDVQMATAGDMGAQSRGDFQKLMRSTSSGTNSAVMPGNPLASNFRAADIAKVYTEDATLGALLAAGIGGVIGIAAGGYFGAAGRLIGGAVGAGAGALTNEALRPEEDVVLSPDSGLLFDEMADNGLLFSAYNTLFFASVEIGADPLSAIGKGGRVAKVAESISSQVRRASTVRANKVVAAMGGKAAKGLEYAVELAGGRALDVTSDFLQQGLRKAGLVESEAASIASRWSAEGTRVVRETLAKTPGEASRLFQEAGFADTGPRGGWISRTFFRGAPDSMDSVFENLRYLDRRGVKSIMPGSTFAEQARLGQRTLFESTFIPFTNINIKNIAPKFAQKIDNAFYSSLTFLNHLPNGGRWFRPLTRQGKALELGRRAFAEGDEGSMRAARADRVSRARKAMDAARGRKGKKLVEEAKKAASAGKELTDLQKSALFADRLMRNSVNIPGRKTVTGFLSPFAPTLMGAGLGGIANVVAQGEMGYEEGESPLQAFLYGAAIGGAGLGIAARYSGPALAKVGVAVERAFQTDTTTNTLRAAEEEAAYRFQHSYGMYREAADQMISDVGKALDGAEPDEVTQIMQRAVAIVEGEDGVVSAAKTQALEERNKLRAYKRFADADRTVLELERQKAALIFRGREEAVNNALASSESKRVTWGEGVLEQSGEVVRVDKKSRGRAIATVRTDAGEEVDVYLGKLIPEGQTNRSINAEARRQWSDVQEGVLKRVKAKRATIGADLGVDAKKMKPGEATTAYLMQQAKAKEAQALYNDVLRKTKQLPEGLEEIAQEVAERYAAFADFTLHWEQTNKVGLSKVFAEGREYFGRMLSDEADLLMRQNPVFEDAVTTVNGKIARGYEGSSTKKRAFDKLSFEEANKEYRKLLTEELRKRGYTGDVPEDIFDSDVVSAMKKRAEQAQMRVRQSTRIHTLIEMLNPSLSDDAVDAQTKAVVEYFDAVREAKASYKAQKEASTEAKRVLARKEEAEVAEEVSRRGFAGRIDEAKDALGKAIDEARPYAEDVVSKREGAARAAEAAEEADASLLRTQKEAIDDSLESYVDQMIARSEARQEELTFREVLSETYATANEAVDSISPQVDGASLKQADDILNSTLDAVRESVEGAAKLGEATDEFAALSKQSESWTDRLRAAKEKASDALEAMRGAIDASQKEVDSLNQSIEEIRQAYPQNARFLSGAMAKFRASKGRRGAAIFSFPMTMAETEYVAELAGKLRHNGKAPAWAGKFGSANTEASTTIDTAMKDLDAALSSATTAKEISDAQDAAQNAIAKARKKFTKEMGDTYSRDAKSYATDETYRLITDRKERVLSAADEGFRASESAVNARALLRARKVASDLAKEQKAAAKNLSEAVEETDKSVVEAFELYDSVADEMKLSFNEYRGKKYSESMQGIVADVLGLQQSIDDARVMMGESKTRLDDLKRAVDRAATSDAMDELVSDGPLSLNDTIKGIEQGYIDLREAEMVVNELIQNASSLDSEIVQAVNELSDLFKEAPLNWIDESGMLSQAGNDAFKRIDDIANEAIESAERTLAAIAKSIEAEGGFIVDDAERLFGKSQARLSRSMLADTLSEAFESEAKAAEAIAPVVEKVAAGDIDTVGKLADELTKNVPIEHADNVKNIVRRSPSLQEDFGLQQTEGVGDAIQDALMRTGSDGASEVYTPRSAIADIATQLDLAGNSKAAKALLEIIDPAKAMPYGELRKRVAAVLGADAGRYADELAALTVGDMAARTENGRLLLNRFDGVDAMRNARASANMMRLEGEGAREMVKSAREITQSEAARATDALQAAKSAQARAVSANEALKKTVEKYNNAFRDQRSIAALLETEAGSADLAYDAAMNAMQPHYNAMASEYRRLEAARNASDAAVSAITENFQREYAEILDAMPPDVRALFDGLVDSSKESLKTLLGKKVPLKQATAEALGDLGDFADEMLRAYRRAESMGVEVTADDVLEGLPPKKKYEFLRKHFDRLREDGVIPPLEAGEIDGLEFAYKYADSVLPNDLHSLTKLAMSRVPAAEKAAWDNLDLIKKADASGKLGNALRWYDRMGSAVKRLMLSMPASVFRDSIGVLGQMFFLGGLYKTPDLIPKAAIAMMRGADVAVGKQMIYQGVAGGLIGFIAADDRDRYWATIAGALGGASLAKAMRGKVGKKLADAIMNAPIRTPEGPMLADEMFAEARRWGLFNEGSFVSREVDRGAGATTKAGRAYRKATDVGLAHREASDAYGRMATYMHARTHLGLSPADSVDYAKRYFFDYSDVTNFENSVLRRFALFYTFTRRAVPLVVREALENPIRIKMMMLATGMGDDEEHIGGSVGLKVGMKPDGTPIKMEIGDNAITAVARLGEAEDMMDFGRRVLNMAHPGIKAPIEYLTQRDSFTGKLISGDPDDIENFRTANRAPAWIGLLPRGVREDFFGFRPRLDDSGEVVEYTMDPTKRWLLEGVLPLSGVHNLITDVTGADERYDYDRGLLRQTGVSIREVPSASVARKQLRQMDDAIESLQRSIYNMRGKPARVERRAGGVPVVVPDTTTARGQELARALEKSEEEAAQWAKANGLNREQSARYLRIIEHRVWEEFSPPLAARRLALQGLSATSKNPALRGFGGSRRDLRKIAFEGRKKWEKELMEENQEKLDRLWNVVEQRQRALLTR